MAFKPRPPGPLSPSEAPTRWAYWLAQERALALWLHGASSVPAIVLLLMAVSWLGDGWLWYGIVLGLPLGGGASGWRCALHIVLLGAVNLQIYWLLKRRIARPRPFVSCPGIRACARSLDEFSFPSGHAMHAVAFSLVLAAYYPSLAVLLWSFTALVALSRVVLGLHYPSDVVIGAAIGLFTAECSLRFI
ncbi:MAG TPA: phosphatase PAP2 family protein [Burkholderiaceae bacterium]|jgi:undecaprenyl-diphosphatase|nr:phosphatase PAP2 family protein [Burkholderiaceae bacterium]